MADNPVRTVSQAASAAAEQFKPNWKVVPNVQVAARAAGSDAIKVDATTPELDVLRKRYFPTEAAAVQAPSTGKAELVTMAPAGQAVSPAGLKAVLVENGKVIGEQG